MSTSISEINPVTDINQQYHQESIELKSLHSKVSKVSAIAEATAGNNVNESMSTPQERTARHRRTERIHLLTLYWVLLLAGWNDASTGPLLPRIQRVYHLGFTVVSVLFVTACCVSLLLIISQSKQLDG